MESLYKTKEIEECKVLAETDTTILLKTKKGNKVYSKRELGKRAKVQGRKQKVWAETEDTGDDDNLISLSRGREKPRIEPLDEATEVETEQTRQEEETSKTVKQKKLKPTKLRKAPMEWSQITSDEESDEIEELPLNRLQLMADSKGCNETIKELQKAIQIHENRQSILEEMRERRREASQGSVKSSQSSDWYTDDSAQSVVDVSSQDEEEDASVFIKEENPHSELEDQDSHETEPEMPTPVEVPASQR